MKTYEQPFIKHLLRNLNSKNTFNFSINAVFNKGYKQDLTKS